MKLAVIGHTSSIGKHLYNRYNNSDHEVIGFSRFNGYKLSSTDTEIINKVVDSCADCSVIINAAYDMKNHKDNFQLALFLALYDRYKDTNKHIINISSTASTLPKNRPISSVLPSIDYIRNKKRLCITTRSLRLNNNSIKLSTIRPGILENKSAYSIRVKRGYLFYRDMDQLFDDAIFYNVELDHTIEKRANGEIYIDVNTVIEDE